MKSASEAYAKRHKLMQTEEQQVSIHKVDKPFNCATCSKLLARCTKVKRTKRDPSKAQKRSKSDHSKVQKYTCDI